MKCKVQIDTTFPDADIYTQKTEAETSIKINSANCQNISPIEQLWLNCCKHSWGPVGKYRFCTMPVASEIGSQNHDLNEDAPS